MGLTEDIIDEMSLPFFDDVLEALGKRVTYDAVVNYAGNSFCEKSWEMISDNNPLSSVDQKKKQGMKLLEGLDMKKVKTVKRGEKPLAPTN